MKTREQIQKEVMELLQGLSGDWEYGGEITPDTYLLSDMGLESLDVVVLGTAVQERYGRVLPFAQFFAEIGQRERQDVSVREWVDFIYRHMNDVPSLSPTRGV